MRDAPHTSLDQKRSDEANKDLHNRRGKRNRITKKAEVTVHQWTFSTEVK